MAAALTSAPPHHPQLHRARHRRGPTDRRPQDTKFCIACGHSIPAARQLLPRLREAPMNCPSCGAPMHPQATASICDYCHNVVVPDTDDDGVSVLDEPARPVLPHLQRPAHAGHARQLASALLHQMPRHVGRHGGVPDPHRRRRAPPARQHHSAARDSTISTAASIAPTAITPWRPTPTPAPATSSSTPASPAAHWLDHGELARIAQAPDDRGPDPDYRDPDADQSDDQSSAFDTSDDTYGSLGWKFHI